MCCTYAFQEQKSLSTEKKLNKDDNSSKTAASKRKKESSSGWFGGWFGGVFRSKNQMKLPDDKNPSVSIFRLFVLLES